MILILSQAHLEASTEDVMDWIERLGGRCLRLNGEDLDGDAALTFTLDGTEVRLQIEPSSGTAPELASGGAASALPLAEVRAVWFRRWLGLRRHETAELLDEPLPSDTAAAGPPSPSGPPTDYLLRRHLTLESRKLSDFFFARLADRPWLSHPGRAGPAKLDVLARAARLGLAIPATLVTTERDELRRFCAAHGTVVTKPIGEVELFVHGGRRHFMYTAELDLEAVERLPPRFAPSLFQERLEKSYELRVFYLDGDCWAMAIFSQLDRQTRTDFRNYNQLRPNRNVPYRLRQDTAVALSRLMRELELETGSIDLVRTPDRREVFLEVNPVGQFGMVSKPCNYGLERKLAEHLLRLAGRRPPGAAEARYGS